MNFQAENHYVAQLSLRRFASSLTHIWTYRLLVSHSKVPEWEEKSTRGVARYTHLYTRLAAGAESDEIEKWLNHDFETPAAGPLEKVSTNSRLAPDDWRILGRFAVAQDVRTPARLMQHQERWDREIPPLLDNVLRDSVAEIKRLKECGQLLEKQPLTETSTHLADYIPMRVRREISPGAESGQLGIEVLAGRALWLYSIKHILTNTIGRLCDHRWTILKPPLGITWFTSDDPLIRLNYYTSEKYDFEGGWGKKGTEIFMPLDPQHLLYTKVGGPVPKRGTMLSHPEALVFRRMIAEHAFRMIYSATPDTDIPKLRPRVVDDALLKYENAQWLKWNEAQTDAEREFMSDVRQKTQMAEPSE